MFAFSIKPHLSLGLSACSLSSFFIHRSGFS
nr:MAG TPA: hypothetical protein [Caudoviricetes sp.]